MTNKTFPVLENRHYFNTTHAFPYMEMSSLVMDEERIRKLPLDERFAHCDSILRNDEDESKRWDAVWLAGEIAEVCKDDKDKKELFDKVADLMAWVIKNDDNGVVIHEASFQIAARNMREKIPDLIECALDKNSSVLAKHESIESLGLMRAFEARDAIHKALDDPSIDVRQTAAFVIKRLKRLEGAGEYNPSKIL